MGEAHLDDVRHEVLGQVVVAVGPGARVPLPRAEVHLVDRHRLLVRRSGRGARAAIHSSSVHWWRALRRPATPWPGGISV